MLENRVEQFELSRFGKFTEPCRCDVERREEHLDDKDNEDTFIANTPEPESAIEDIPKTKNININLVVNAVCAVMSQNIVKIVQTFSPLIDFMESIGTTQELDKLLHNAQDKMKKDGIVFTLSDKVFERLCNDVDELTKKGNLENVHLSELIKRWREREDTKCLFEMAKRIKEGKCSSINDEKLRELFVRSLESLAESIEEL